MLIQFIGDRCGIIIYRCNLNLTNLCYYLTKTIYYWLLIMLLDFMNESRLMASITIGINEWLAPQISEHCPYKILGLLIIREVWFSRPGIESIFTLSDGIVYEWITSDAVTSSRISVFTGRIARLSTSSNRISPIFRFIVFSINELWLIRGKLSYEYLQYHWWPVALIVINGFTISSIRYNKHRDGIAINSKIIAGIIVQIISMLWDSFSKRYWNLLFMININIYLIIVVTRTIINISISWNHSSDTEIIDLGSCSSSCIHGLIWR